MDKTAFTVVVKKYVPHGANIFVVRFVLAINNKETENEIYEARFVVQEHIHV